MDYQIIETEFMGQLQQHVVIDHGDNTFESFPVDEDNPRYMRWLNGDQEEQA